MFPLPQGGGGPRSCAGHVDGMCCVVCRRDRGQARYYVRDSLFREFDSSGSHMCTYLHG